MRLVVEADCVEDGLHASADVVEFALGNILDAADIAAAEVVDDGVEAVAGVVVRGGVDLVAGFGADAAVFVVAMGEGDAGDLRCRDGVRGAGDGLSGALVGGDVGGDAEVEEGSAKGGVGVRVEADGSYGTHLGGVGGVAGVEVEGADVTVSAGDVPGGWDGEGDAVARVVEGTRGRGGRFGRGGPASQKGRDRFGFAWNGFRWRLPKRRQKRQQSESEIGENSGEFHAFLFWFFVLWLGLRFGR